MTTYIDEHWGTGTSLPNFAPTKANDSAIRQWWGKFERLGASPSAAIYIAAFIPDQGESAVGLLSQAPAANKDMRATKDDFLYLEPAAFPADFAADVPPAQASFMAHSQGMVAKAAAGAPVTTAAWHQKKSWALVATKDRNINPDLERSMAKRAGSETIEVAASHAVYVSKPEDVARLIERAAKASAQ